MAVLYPLRWRTISGRVEVYGLDGARWSRPRYEGDGLLRFRKAVIGRWARLIEENARRTRVPANWIAAFVAAESWGDPRAVSPAGATGLMQLMPFHWRGHSQEAMFEPERNVAYGADLLAWIRKTETELPRAASVYNCGADDAGKAHAWPSPKPAERPFGLCEDSGSGYILNVIRGSNTALDTGIGGSFVPFLAASLLVGGALAAVAYRVGAWGKR